MKSMTYTKTCWHSDSYKEWHRWRSNENGRTSDWGLMFLTLLMLWRVVADFELGLQESSNFPLYFRLHTKKNNAESPHKKKKHLNFFSILNMASKHAQFILPHFIILRDFTGPLKGHSSVNELSHKLNESTFQSFLAFCNDKQCFVCLEIIKASIFPLFPFHFSQTQKKTMPQSMQRSVYKADWNRDVPPPRRRCWKFLCNSLA